MMKLLIPENYKARLNILNTEKAILLIKQEFEKNISKALDLTRVSAPLFVRPETGINDDLNGTEKPVSFEIKEMDVTAQIVHSLAKWKRLALYKYEFTEGKGLYTDMNAIRRDEELTNLHSIYVDQWDWEKIITRETRNIELLKLTVTDIVEAICNTLDTVRQEYPQIELELSRDVHFVTTQELEDTMPELTPSQREDEIARKYHTVFIMQIGDTLKSGKKHDGRAPDYDDWELNGDIIFYNKVLDRAFEVSSMGIRVDKESLLEQLTKSGCEDRANLEFHKLLLEEKLPLTMGGGIGQSRLCMLLLQKAHIGEVQASIWPGEVVSVCKEKEIYLL